MKSPHFFAALLSWLLATGNVSAGMTVITLTDVAAARIDALSFFLATYLVISLVVKAIWNQLAKSFASLPRFADAGAVRDFLFRARRAAPVGGAAGNGMGGNPSLRKNETHAQTYHNG